MKQWGFWLRLDHCVGCRTCQLACKKEKGTSSRINLRRVREERGPGGELYFLSLACNHCSNPECFRVCPEKAYWKRRDGIVLHLPRRCQGCRACVQACPYQAPQYNVETHKAEKCDFCRSRLEQGLLPACVEACPTGALNIIVGEESPGGTSYSRRLPSLPDPALTRPSLHLSWERSTRAFWRRDL
ncbi:MAG: 4Fe-4S dicluster domain-containing protein [Thermoanaerobacteraceae bacterium]|nr:4Fe-4S dicluster domain-containing protein [Thermoanaerobacteraceae bacterium]